jgi:hypothetical protein
MAPSLFSYVLFEFALLPRGGGWKTLRMASSAESHRFTLTDAMLRFSGSSNTLCTLAEFNVTNTGSKRKVKCDTELPSPSTLLRPQRVKVIST